MRFEVPKQDEIVIVEKPKREPKPRRKNAPKLVAAARELRDRWLEQVNADESLILPRGKYDVTKALTPLPAAGLSMPHRAIAA